jgi:hypothetical protein
LVQQEQEDLIAAKEREEQEQKLAELEKKAMVSLSYPLLVLNLKNFCQAFVAGKAVLVLTILF